MKRLIKTSILATAVLLSAPTTANPLALAGVEMVKKYMMGVAINLTSDYLSPSNPSQETLAKNQQQIAELNKKFDELQKQTTTTPQLESAVKKLSETLVQMQSEMNQKLEQRQANAEKHLASIQQAQQKIEAATTETPIKFPMSYQYRPAQDSTGQFQALTENAVLHSGDTYKVIFTPNENLYIYIFQQDASNQVQRIFPMEEYKGIRLNNHNPVEKGRQYVLPTKEKSFRLDKTTGTEKIYFLASRYKDAVLENLPQIMHLPKAASIVAALQNKGFDDIVSDDKVHTLQWQENNQNMSADLNTRLQSCSGCLNVLTFEHQ
jgi:Skp family chaperone for outer membrane proteins